MVIFSKNSLINMDKILSNYASAKMERKPPIQNSAKPDHNCKNYSDPPPHTSTPSSIPKPDNSTRFMKTPKIKWQPFLEPSKESKKQPENH